MLKVIKGSTHRLARGLNEVIPKVYQLPLAGTSALLLVEDKITVIDAGWKGNGRRVCNAITSLGRAPDEIGYIVSTHYHQDHVGGIPNILQRSAGLVAAHESEIPFLQNTPLPNPVQNPIIRLLAAPVFGLLQPKPFQVDLPLSDGARLEVMGGMEIVHSPGHTPGSISLHFPEHGVLMVGDALECKRGKLGLPSRIFSSNLQEAKESVRKLAKLDFEILCFSHFPPLKKNATKLLSQFADSLV